MKEKNNRKENYVCNSRSMKCPEDCIHYQAHDPILDISVLADGRMSEQLCCFVDMPCGYRMSEAIVTKCEVFQDCRE